MSENRIELVDQHVSLENAPREGERMERWLQAQGIIRQGQRLKDYKLEFPNSTIVSSGNPIIYGPGPDYRKSCDHLICENSTDQCLEIITERTVFHGGTWGVGFYCPECGEEQAQHGEAWSETVETWWRGKPESLTCVKCGYKAPLLGWRFDPIWGFGNLGFSFRNWFPEPEFIKAFEEELGRPLIVVQVHL